MEILDQFNEKLVSYSHVCHTTHVSFTNISRQKPEAIPHPDCHTSILNSVTLPEIEERPHVTQPRTLDKQKTRENQEK